MYVPYFLVNIAMIILLKCNSIHGKSRNMVGNIMFIPGKSCGVKNAIFKLDNEIILEKLTSPEDFECAVVESKRMYQLAMEQLKFLRSNAGDKENPNTHNNNQATDLLDVSQHYPYCQEHPEAIGLFFKVSPEVIVGCTSARAFCEEHGMSLVVIRTKEEFDLIKSFLESTEVPGKIVLFFFNGHFNKDLEKFIHPCKSQTCGADVIQWNDPGGLPFDGTLYGTDWLQAAPGKRTTRDCLALDSFGNISNKRYIFRGVASGATHHAVCMARCAGSPSMPAGRFQYCHDNQDRDDIVLINKGELNYTDAVAACQEESMHLVVVRKSAELVKIQGLIGTGIPFYLAGHTSSNETCSQGDCNDSHIAWLDGGKRYNPTLYDGSFLNSKVSKGVLHTCLHFNVTTDPPTVEDIDCTETLRAVCMVDCAEWKAILQDRT